MSQLVFCLQNFSLLGLKHIEIGKLKKQKKRKKYFKIELSRKLPLQESPEKNIEMEAETANKSKIFEMTPSTIEFMKNSDAWINTEDPQKESKTQRFK